MKIKTRSIAFMAILIAMMLLFGFTPIGYIPLPFAKLTLMCLPVIIGTLVLGLRTGMGLAAVFIITSIAQLFMAPDVVAVMMFTDNPLVFILCLIVPRLLIPPVVWGVHTLLAGRIKKGSMIVASAAGSLVNTFVYLGMLQLFFVPALTVGLSINAVAAAVMIWTVVLTNGLPEAVIAAVVCPLVAGALKKSIVPITNNKESAKA